MNTAWGYSDHRFVLDLNENGTFAGWLDSRYRRQDYTKKGYAWRPKAHVNANGGTVRVVKGLNYVFGHWYDESILTGKVLPDEVTLYGKGLTAEAADDFMSIDVPLVSVDRHEGKGVASVDWSGADLGTYRAVPIVEILGDGTNATACASLNEDGTLKNIRISSAGYGYSWAKAKILAPKSMTGSSYVFAELDCTLKNNDVGGGLTKTGPKELWLRWTNDYTGDTVLKGGTTVCYTNGAIPAASTVVLAGGTLNMNGYTMADGSVAPKKWAVDAVSAAAAGGVTYDGDFTFLEGATFNVRNIDNLPDDQRSSTLLTVTGTITGAKPTLAASPDPHYVTTWSGNTLKLKRLYGTVITIR